MSVEQQNLLQAAHDLRAPVAAIMAVLESHGDFCANKKLLARQALMRILHLAENILVENRSSIPSIQRSSVVEFIESLLMEKKVLFPNLKINLRDESKSVQMSIDKLLQIQRVLCGLIQNCAEAMENQEEPLVRIHLKIRYSKILIVVEDNGPGIVNHIREKLGKEPMSYMKSNGNGLGLYYSNQIIKSIGGEMKIHSRVNEGTRVTITLKR